MAFFPHRSGKEYPLYSEKREIQCASAQSPQKIFREAEKYCNWAYEYFDSSKGILFKDVKSIESSGIGEE
jgi:hypothetical protein